jgi:hypothetical protein
MEGKPELGKAEHCDKSFVRAIAVDAYDFESYVYWIRT